MQRSRLSHQRRRRRKSLLKIIHAFPSQVSHKGLALVKRRKSLLKIIIAFPRKIFDFVNSFPPQVSRGGWRWDPRSVEGD